MTNPVKRLTMMATFPNIYWYYIFFFGENEVDMMDDTMHRQLKNGKRVKRLFLVFQFFLIAGLLFSFGGGEKGTMTVSGKVTDQDGRKLEGVRVVALFEAEGGKKSSTVAYSDDKGRIEMVLPIGQTVSLMTTGQGYRRFKGQQNVQVGSTTLNFPIVLEPGWEEIEPGSLDQVQLYVNIGHQQAIDDLIGKGLFEEITGYINRMIPQAREQLWASCLAGHFLFERGFENEAERFFQAGNSRWQANRLAEAAMKAADNVAALDYYRQGEISWDRAVNLFKLATRFKSVEDRPHQDEALNLAVDGYKRAISSFFLRPFLETETAMARILEMGDLEETFFNPQEPVLKDLLEKVGSYCETMERKSILYMCRENKVDRILISPDMAKAEDDPLRHFSKPRVVDFTLSPVEVKEEFDVQLYETEDGKIEEDRKLLHKKIEQKFNVPQLDSIDVNKAHFGPNSMVGKIIQPYFYYRIIGETVLFDEEAVMVEAIPKWAASAFANPGMVWISKKTGAVLKIERFYKLVTGKSKIRLRGLILALEPRLIFTSEFSFQKNGVRYPSRLSVREAYFDGNAEKIIRLEIESRFSNYQFFGVSSDVTVEKIKE